MTDRDSLIYAGCRVTNVDETSTTDVITGTGEQHCIAAQIAQSVCS